MVPLTEAGPAGAIALIDFAAASPRLRASVLRLHQTHEQALSPIDAAGLAAVAAISYRAWIGVGEDQDPETPEAAALLIAMASGARYDSVNFQWFAARHDRFAYVDRVVVAERAQGSGLGRRLYTALCDAARADGYPVLGCEVNVVPPNPASHAFHQRMGFQPLDDRSDAATGKTVRYYAKDLGTPIAAGA